MAVSENYPSYLLQKSGKIDSPLILASPHSGTFYPERLFHLSDRKLEEFQKNEDAAVDKLFSFAPACGIPLLSAVYGRTWVDLNRHPLELDPDMFSDSLPPQARDVFIKYWIRMFRSTKASFCFESNKSACSIFIFRIMPLWPTWLKRICPVSGIPSFWISIPCPILKSIGKSKTERPILF